MFYLNEDFADITFCFETVKIPAHRIILATRSTFFRALLCGGFAESNLKEISLKVQVDSFKSLLLYIYSGELSLNVMTEDQILDILCLASEYCVFELVAYVSKHLRKMLQLENVWKILDIAQTHHFHTLIDACWDFVDLHAQVIIEFSFEYLSEVRSDFILFLLGERKIST